MSTDNIHRVSNMVADLETSLAGATAIQAAAMRLLRVMHGGDYAAPFGVVVGLDDAAEVIKQLADAAHRVLEAVDVTPGDRWSGLIKALDHAAWWVASGRADVRRLVDAVRKLRAAALGCEESCIICDSVPWAVNSIEAVTSGLRRFCAGHSLDAAIARHKDLVEKHMKAGDLRLGADAAAAREDAAAAREEAAALRADLVERTRERDAALAAVEDIRRQRDTAAKERDDFEERYRNAREEAAELRVRIYRADHELKGFQQ